MSYAGQYPNMRRRATTLVLVVGILVLLVIIATGYVTRTHAGRVTSASHQRNALRQDNAQAIAEFLAGEVAGALFVRPVDTSVVSPGVVADARAPRLSFRDLDLDGDGFADDYTPVRYGANPIDFVNNATGMAPPDGVPDYLYNFAPYHVVPFTNWPDAPPTATNPAPASPWPFGPGAPGGVPFEEALPATDPDFLLGEGNPLGNPGFGDSRWLADTEPLRLPFPIPGVDGTGGTLDDLVFSHWRHLTNIARPGNGWRMCRDISDVTNAINPGDRHGGLVTDLRIPVEQWLRRVPQPSSVDLATGNPMVPIAEVTTDSDGDGQPDFMERWSAWTHYGFESLAPNDEYVEIYRNPAFTPANFYNLRDLVFDSDGDGVNQPLEPGERPQDEFIGPSPSWPFGTPRYNVGRVLADADGDGFTDSFWFLAPTTIEGGIRQVVAVRIVDNGGLLNANVATRFMPSDPGGVVPPPTKTSGLTPADLALAGQLEQVTATPGPLQPSLPHWNVAFFDNPDHWFDENGDGFADAGEFVARYGGCSDWCEHVAEVGIATFADCMAGCNPAAAQFFPNQVARLDYWGFSGLRSLGADPLSFYTPYGIPEELELRMFHGNNHPWIYSRLERTTQPGSTANRGLLRGATDRIESSEYLTQIPNWQLVRDMRRKVTVYNGARNDLMPPWLRPLAFPFDIDGDNAIEEFERNEFTARARKVDLRRPFLRPDGTFDFDVDGDGLVGTDEGFTAFDDDLNDDGTVDAVDHREAIRDRLEAALLIDVDRDGELDPNLDESYYGNNNTEDLERARRLAASFAANIDAYRDDDVLPLPLALAVRWTESGPPSGATRMYRYVGMEAQPFLVEAFVAHVHESDVTAIFNHGDPANIGAGDNILCDGSPQSTIVVVQIANPFLRTVPLDDFRLRVFDDEGDEVPDNPDQELRFADFPALNVPLQPGESRVYYAIDGTAEAIDDCAWKQLLGILDPGCPAGTVQNLPLVSFVDVTALLTPMGDPIWSTERFDYESADPEHAIELVRMIDDDGSGTTRTPVVVDRFDVKFAEGSLDADELGQDVTDLSDEATGDCAEPPAGELWPNVGNLFGASHWVQWVRTSRAWALQGETLDVDFDGILEQQEWERIPPRYVFAYRTVEGRTSDGYPTSQTYSETDPPEDWFALERVAHFDRIRKTEAEAGSGDIEDADRVDFPIQMLQKDGDFEQVGELLNVWLFGHELEFVSNLPGFNVYRKTHATFSEFMREEIEDLWSDVQSGDLFMSDLTRVNRLRTAPTPGDDPELSPIISVPDKPVGPSPNYVLQPAHGVPALPAGARVLDAFVCDGQGVSPGDLDGNGVPNEIDDILLAPYPQNAHRFSGKATPGLVNVNTAPLEVMRAIPHWYRLIHEEDPEGTVRRNPFAHLAEGVVRYRDRLGNPVNASDELPAYNDRGVDLSNEYIGYLPAPCPAEPCFGVRGDRGLASVGELTLLRRAGKRGKTGGPATGINYAPTGGTTDNLLFNSSFRIDYGVVPERDALLDDGFPLPADPYLFPEGPGMGSLYASSSRISTDVNDVKIQPVSGPTVFRPDVVAEDAEEANVLFAGASNMVTTRSDVFTVYFRVRSFRQNPTTGVWDATDPEHIVDDSRYVMLVDRSEVDHPDDEPRIVYLEKVPK